MTDIIRICKICKKEFPLTEFNTNGLYKGKVKYHLSCKKCSTKDTMLRCVENKIKAVEYLGGKCEHCSETNIIVLQFHHLDKNIKEASWCDMKRWGWERMKVELEKCILLCANCHLIEHAVFYKEIDLNIIKNNMN